MQLTNWHKGILATLAAHIIWGVAGPLVKIVLTDIPPLSLLFLRSLFTVIVLFPIFEFKLLPKLTKSKTDFLPLNREDKRDMFLAGFFGVFLNIALYFWGQTMTTVIDAWVIASTGTLFLVIYSYFFLKERLAKVVYLGVGIAFIGTLVIIGSPIFQFGQGDMRGNLLMLGSTISAVASYLIIKKLVAKFDPLLIVFYTFLIATILTIPFMLWEFVQNPYWMAAVTTSDLLIIGYLVAGSSITAYVLSNLGLKQLPASIASTLSYSSTIVAIILSVIFLKENPTIYFIIGSVLIIFGLILAEARHKRTHNK